MRYAPIVVVTAALLATGSALAQSGPTSDNREPVAAGLGQPDWYPPPGAIVPSMRPDHPEPPAAAMIPGAVPTIALQEDPTLIRRNPKLPAGTSAGTDVPRQGQL